MLEFSGSFHSRGAIAVSLSLGLGLGPYLWETETARTRHVTQPLVLFFATERVRPSFPPSPHFLVDHIAEREGDAQVLYSKAKALHAVFFASCR